MGPYNEINFKTKLKQNIIEPLTVVQKSIFIDACRTY